MCSKTFGMDTACVPSGLAVGLPELVAPFTKIYDASAGAVWGTSVGLPWLSGPVRVHLLT